MMGTDPRFPNRKKKATEQPLFGDKLADTELPETNSPEIPAEPLHFTSYKIIGSDPEPPMEELVAPELPIPDPVIAKLETKPDSNPEANPETLSPIEEGVYAAPRDPVLPPAPPRPPFREVCLQRARKFAESPTRVYAAAGGALGILLAVIIATFFFGSNADLPFDLGSETSNAAGLRGYLFIKWEKRVEYRLMLEPMTPELRAGFALAASHPLRPLSVNIQLKDDRGFVLCSKDILLKYDARNVAEPAALTPELQAGQSAPEIDLAKLDAQEAVREQGMDIFQNQLGADGQVTSINAQGQIPCSKKAYESTSSWSMSPNFPPLAEQDEWLKRKQQLEAKAARPPAKTPDPRKIAAAKQLLPFTIEGDDAIVDLDTYHGVIQTRGRKTFFFDKNNQAAADYKWQEYPVSIHFKCDRSSECQLMHSGLGALRVRMRR
jgi:hypothetical protein